MNPQKFSTPFLNSDDLQKSPSGAIREPERSSPRTDISESGASDIGATLNGILADVFALYLKTKNFHWHMSGPHFRDYHLLLDEQGDQLFAMTDELAERVRKLGRSTLRSIGEIKSNQTLLDNEADFVEPGAMLAELGEDNHQLVRRMREAHDVCDDYNDVGSTSLLENWISEAERRVWFLFQISHRGNADRQ
jgi:starvation-inducible DNA-binding protein